VQLKRHLDANVAAGLRTRRFCVLVRLLQNAGLIVTVEGGDITSPCQSPGSVRSTTSLPISLS